MTCPLSLDDQVDTLLEAAVSAVIGSEAHRRNGLLMMHAALGGVAAGYYDSACMLAGGDVKGGWPSFDDWQRWLSDALDAPALKKHSLVCPCSRCIQESM